ncbi:MAG: hypothetical protein Q4P31_02455 [Andreesenia angusta]|nr:hypothetical protein [Andreesenia angusta]
MDWKTVETHNLRIIEEKKDLLKTDRDKIKLNNIIEISKYRLENDIAPDIDQNTVKGYIEYTFFNNKNIFYIVTIIIILSSLSIRFDKASFYYLGAFGYKKIFFSKILSGVLFSIFIWIMNFAITYIIGIKNFGSYSGNIINYIDGNIVITVWKSYIIKAIILSLTYPVFASIIPMMFSSIFNRINIAAIASLVFYIAIEPLRYGYLYPNILAKYTFIGNLYILKPINGIPGLYFDGIKISLLIDILWLILFIFLAYKMYRKYLFKILDKKEDLNYSQV